MEFPPKIHSSTPFPFFLGFDFGFLTMKPKLARIEMYIFQMSIGEVHFATLVRRDGMSFQFFEVF